MNDIQYVLRELNVLLTRQNTQKKSKARRRRHRYLFDGWLIVLWWKCFMNHTHTHWTYSKSLSNSWSQIPCALFYVCHTPMMSIIAIVVILYLNRLVQKKMKRRWSECNNNNNKTWKKYQIQIWFFLLLNTIHTTQHI